VLWYNSAQFEEAGAFPPENGWTIDDFEDALRALRASSEDEDVPPFTGSFNAGYILMLIASYGGMPVDTIANPPIVNLTDPINVEAIRQVLDLARDGFIDYSELGNFSGGGGGFRQSAIYDETLSSFSFQFQVAPGDENPYRLTTYPSGTQYTPVSYGIGSGYISATAQNPDACYRFISALSQRPDLLGGVPARLSLIDDPAYAASQSPDALNFYRSYFETLADPNLVVLPGNFGSGDQFPGLFVLQLWLYRAFDAYVLEDGDLDAELQQAQMFSEAYLECTADIPPFDESLQTTQEEQIEYFTQFARCAVLVDPETESLFGGLLAEED
jgi:ABC-type glycerol-3-phosphate transport system substrate-binding protein